MLSEQQLAQRRDASAAAAVKRRARTHCIRGHEFTEENTFVSTLGKRVCRTCASDRDFYYRSGVFRLMQLDSEHPKHGTAFGYGCGCRCIRCKVAVSTARQDNPRKSRAKAGLDTRRPM